MREPGAAIVRFEPELSSWLRGWVPVQSRLPLEEPAFLHERLGRPAGMAGV